MKSPLKFPSFHPSAITALLITVGFCALAVIDNMALVGCTQAQVTQGEADAETAANILETINTATGGGVTLFTQDAADAALKATHNTGDVGVVNATIAEAAAALKVQQAAAAAGLSSTAAQKATTAVLTDPSVIATGAAAAAGPTGVPTAMLKLAPAKDLRAPFGSREYASIYDLR